MDDPKFLIRLRYIDASRNVPKIDTYTRYQPFLMKKCLGGLSHFILVGEEHCHLWVRDSLEVTVVCHLTSDTNFFHEVSIGRYRHINVFFRLGWAKTLTTILPAHNIKLPLWCWRIFTKIKLFMFQLNSETVYYVVLNFTIWYK